MGANASTDVEREYKVYMRPGTSFEQHDVLMVRLKEVGCRIGFVYWPNEPLGFTAFLVPARHMSIISECKEVQSCQLCDNIRHDEAVPNGDSIQWRQWLCGGARPSTGRLPLSQHPSAPPAAASAADTTLGVVQDEAQARAAFAAALAPLTTDGLTATRFLRAKGFDAREAAAFYRAYQEWRAAERVDSVLLEPSLPFEQEAALRAAFSPRLLDGVDLLERPVVFFAVHDVDLTALSVAGVREEDLLRRYVRTMEQMRLAVERSHHPLRGHLAIYDVRQVSILSLFRTLSFWLRIGKCVEANYPETLGHMCIVGAPSGSEWMLERLRSFMAPTAAAKVRMHSGDPCSALLGLLPPDLVPPDLCGDVCPRPPRPPEPGSSPRGP
jgi:hypothetical protein